MKKIRTIAVVLMISLAFGSIALAQPGRRAGMPEELTPELETVLAEMDALRSQMQEAMAQVRELRLEQLAAEGTISAERLEWIRQGWELNQAEGAVQRHGAAWVDRETSKHAPVDHHRRMHAAAGMQRQQAQSQQPDFAPSRPAKPWLIDEDSVEEPEETASPVGVRHHGRRR